MTSNSVISGVAYPVESVDGRTATLLADFLTRPAEHVAAF